jgi:hypothetical protein
MTEENANKQSAKSYVKEIKRKTSHALALAAVDVW